MTRGSFQKRVIITKTSLRVIPDYLFSDNETLSRFTDLQISFVALTTSYNINISFYIKDENAGNDQGTVYMNIYNVTTDSYDLTQRIQIHRSKHINATFKNISLILDNLTHLENKH